MTTFNWKVVEPNTIRAYTLAARDYETFTGSPVSEADEMSITAWQHNMEDRRLSVNTIRARLSAIGVMSGVKVQLPKRNTECGKTLSLEQVRGLFSVITKKQDRVLMASVLFTGGQPRTFDAHFAGTALVNAYGHLTIREVTRKIKRYAKLAGLNEAEMNLRTMKRSGKALLDEHGATELLKVTTPNPSRDRNKVSYRPLHGIGRRSNSVKA